MRRLSRHRDSPPDRGACDGNVFQAAVYEAQNLVAAALRLDEIGIGGVEVEKLLLELGKLEKIIFFGDGFRRASAIGAIVAGPSVRDVGIVVDAVLAGIAALLNETVFAAALEEPLHGAVVLLIRGADELIARNSQIVPQLLPLHDDFRGIFLGGF